MDLQRFTVAFDFPVVFTRGLFDPGNSALVDVLRRIERDRRHRVDVLIDGGVAEALPALPAAIRAYVERHGEWLELADAPLVLPGGETCKNDPAVLARLHQRIHALGLDRQSFVLIVGGGALLDAAGYAAATAHRGLRVVRVPTTTLGQCDSGVGVKNGVNAFGAKNFLGTFAPPFAVCDDFDFLDVLPLRDKLAGMAEAVKVALIRDASFFAWLEQNAAALAAGRADEMETLVRRCARLHMAHIATSGDPFELGSARPLDFGHWAAHKLEGLTSHALRHGEAVAIGMALDARYAALAGMLPGEQLADVVALLERLGLPTWHDALRALDADGRPALLRGLRDFREHLGGELTITLVDRIGHKVEVHEMDEGRIVAAIDWLEARRR